MPTYRPPLRSLHPSGPGSKQHLFTSRSAIVLVVWIPKHHCSRTCLMAMKVRR
eukprot:jgi/Chlat1/4745/Chrsp308S04721